MAAYSFHMEVIDGEKKSVPHPGESYGRITDVLGMELDGRFACVGFATPGGTHWKRVGAARFTRISEDHPKLVEYEADAAERDEWYDGLLDKDDK